METSKLINTTVKAAFEAWQKGDFIAIPGVISRPILNFTSTWKAK